MKNLTAFERRKIDSKLEFEKCQYKDFFSLQEKIKQKPKYKAGKMASSQDALLTFFTGLRRFHVYRSCWKPYAKQKIEFRKENNNQYDRYAVPGYTKLPGKMVLCVVGHMSREISRYTWFEIEGGANITAQVVSTNTIRSALTQGGLEIEVKVTVIWENKNNLKIFAEKVDSVQFTLGEPWLDDTKNFLHEIKRKENDVCVSVSLDEEPED